ncbi:MAG TPA: hypothetical protein VGC99_18020 [Candidatus Tectomicrobia bacterium]
MISKGFIRQLRSVVQAQHHLLGRLRRAVNGVSQVFSPEQQRHKELAELEQLVTTLEANAAWLTTGDLDGIVDDAIRCDAKVRRQAVTQELQRIGFTDWGSFVQQCEAYDRQQGLDPLLPYEAFLTEDDLAQLRVESYEAQYRWDRWDYLFVGASGVLAALTDYFLVQIPKTLDTGVYAGQEGSPLTSWLTQYDTRTQAGQTHWFAEWARGLEDRCRVPYDAMSFAGPDGVQEIAGMGGRSHRFQSLGHDPVLGFVFGVLDIMRGTITGFSYDKLAHLHTFVHGAVWSNLQPMGLIEAILRQIGHLLSDVATPMGLPAPFMTLFQGLNIGSFGEKSRTVSELARWMYLYGYDFRHFLVSGLTPAVIEIVLRAYLMVRHYIEHGETKFLLGSHPKYRSMLLTAHAVAAAGNAGKIALMQGNPLAINQAEWMAVIRYLIPSLKYWVFDRARLKREHLERINEQGWQALEQYTASMLSVIAHQEFPLIELGRPHQDPLAG